MTVTYIIPARENSRHVDNAVAVSWCETTEPGLSNGIVVGDSSVDASGIGPPEVDVEVGNRSAGSNLTSP